MSTMEYLHPHRRPNGRIQAAVFDFDGTFSTLRAASNVFLDANLGYDPNNVFLNINRIDVTQAIAGAGLGGITAMSASGGAPRASSRVAPS